MNKHVMMLLGACLWTSSARAEVKLNSVISDHAVLQQGIDVPVWGTAKDGEKVTVTFEGQEISTTAKDGKWMLKLKPLKAGGPFTMTVTGENTIEVKDLLVGEVWLCSGQSNMQLGLISTSNSAAVIASSADPQLRLCSVPWSAVADPKPDANVAWVDCNPKTVPNFSAVAYYFGRDLRQTLKVPIGLIHSSVGGTAAQSWTSLEALAANPALRPAFADHGKVSRALEANTAAWSTYQEKQEGWKAEAAKAKAEGKPAPPALVAPKNPALLGLPIVLYNGMIAPLQPYAMRGVIWYQGESNATAPGQYQILFPTLIDCWRDAWGEGAFPFLFVQIAPFKGQPPTIREAQLFSWQHTTNTAMAVITDCGDANNIHPTRKEPVGARLALAARALAYGEKLEYSGPVYESMKIDGDHVILSFQHIGSGLVAQGGALKGFTIAGTNAVFVAADAKIEGATVVVSSKEIEQPVAVRYGWTNVPVVNLFNKEGLPATPFRTGDPAPPAKTK